MNLSSGVCQRRRRGRSGGTAGALVWLFASEVCLGSSVVAFEKVDLPTTQGPQYTTVTMGPDGRLYATVNNGEIRRWPLNADGTTGQPEIITTLRDAEGGNRLLIGMVFDHASTSDHLIAWVSHATFGFSGMEDWGGKITRLSGPNLQNVESYVEGLPRSSRDHVTNGLAIGPDRAIYFLQGSNSSMGAPDSAWANRPERLLTAAVLRLDPALVGSPPLDVRTGAGGSYDPYDPGAALTIFATGVRNAYDLLWHSNGRLYVPVNGSGSDHKTPAGASGAACGDGSTYEGPVVSGLSNVGVQSDYLYRIEEGGYYGHPNPTRCEFVMNGGNPTPATDPAEVGEYPVGTSPDANYRGIAYDFGLHRSPNGVIEYARCVFDGALHGKLLVIRYSQGDDIIVLTPGGPDGDIVAAETGVGGFGGFSNPLDLTENTGNGNLYVAEYGGTRITLLRPLSGVACPLDLDCDGSVNVPDLLVLLRSWGVSGVGADFDGGGVTVSDLLALLARWGPCP